MEVLNRATKEPALRVLLVENDDEDAKLAQHAIERDSAHLDVYRFRTADDALTYLRRDPPYEDAKRPHIIYTDLNMPDKSGFDFLREADGLELEDLPIIVLSNSRDEKDVREAYRLGASLYIVKPSDMDKFVESFAKVQMLFLDVVTVLDPEGGVRAPLEPRGHERPR